MSLEPAAEPFRLYTATGPDVSMYRPLFTGDPITMAGERPTPGISTLEKMCIPARSEAGMASLQNAHRSPR